MDRLQLLEAIERYLGNEMSPAEKESFEQLRNSNPDVDLLVVEHGVFLNQLERYADQKNFRTTLHEIHNELAGKGVIRDSAPKAVVRQMWK